MLKAQKQELFTSLRANKPLPLVSLKNKNKLKEEYQNFFLSSHSSHDWDGIKLKEKLLASNFLPHLKAPSVQSYKARHLSKIIQKDLERILSHVDQNLTFAFIETIKREEKTHYIFIRNVHKKYSKNLGPMVDKVVRKINKYLHLFPECQNAPLFLQVREALVKQNLIKETVKILNKEVYKDRKEFWEKVESAHFDEVLK